MLSIKIQNKEELIQLYFLSHNIWQSHNLMERRQHYEVQSTNDKCNSIHMSLSVEQRL